MTLSPGHLHLCVAGEQGGLLHFCCSPGLPNQAVSASLVTQE